MQRANLPRARHPGGAAIGPLVALLVCAFGCDERSRQAAPRASTPAKAPAKAPAEESAKAPANGPEASHMGAFFEQTTAIKQAVIDGELAATRSPARWLAQHAPPGPHGSPHAVALHDAAKAVGAASTLPAAARAVGSLGQACGDCHTARGVHPRPEGAPTFTDEPAPIEQMHLHQWAADRLWEGLVRPSTEVWRDACDALAGAPLGEDRDDETPRALADAIAGVRAIAERGAEAGPDERAAIYGELLTTCAGCHAARRARE